MESNMIYADSLMADLAAWKRQEELLVTYGNAGDLNDREFKKMKLREFDRMYFIHKGQSDHPDHIALMRVVSYNRNKLEKALYPGLLRRLVRRAFVQGWHKLIGTSTKINLHQENADFTFNTDRIQTDLSQAPGQGKEQRKFMGYDYGAKKEKKPGQGLGM